MGLFDLFKKKEEPENNLNSVFTLRFTIPYFQIFDKTDTQLSAFPIKMAVAGSCQYRIADPDLCIDNVPLRKLLPEQIEAHVRDTLTMNIKTYFNSIKTIPLLQFESLIVDISEAAKERMSALLYDELGLNLRTFNISSVRYDVEDPNYLRLQSISQKIVEHRAKRVDAESEAEIEQIKTDSEIATKKKKALADVEIERSKFALDSEKRRFDEELAFEKTSKESMLDIENRRREAQLEFEVSSRNKEFDIESRNKEASLEIERDKRKKDIEDEREHKKATASLDVEKRKAINEIAKGLKGMAPSTDAPDK